MQLYSGYWIPRLVHILECLYNTSSGTISSSDSSGLRRSPHSRQVQILRAVHLKDSFFNLSSTVGPTEYTAKPDIRRGTGDVSHPHPSPTVQEAPLCRVG